ncbi:protein MHF2 homolog isoform X3 [Panicum virgatum]|uniref:protein MHF2 homolog isoform X3 n=1 Tax=Panicum virgatum TaxID=38727 RepID=UPI0019D60B0B|nr:protein MHF2 homolog isoform X3 [Panicum virgatum]
MDEDAAMSNSRTAETFDPDLIHAIFKLVWRRRAEKSSGGNENIDVEPAPETSRRNRSTTEAIQRSAFIAEAEGATVIEPTHLERVLPQLLLDF